MAATIAPGPIPFLPFTHNQILHAVNLGSLPAWFALVFLPRWRHTEKITIASRRTFLVCYAGVRTVFAGVIFPRFRRIHHREGSQRHAQQSTAVLAGWAHFIVFDLFTALLRLGQFPRRSSRRRRAVYFVGMFFGPVGLLTYGVVKKAHASWVLSPRSKWGWMGQQVRPKEGMTKNARAE